MPFNSLLNVANIFVQGLDLWSISKTFRQWETLLFHCYILREEWHDIESISHQQDTTTGQCPIYFGDFRAIHKVHAQPSLCCSTK
jgi:hypothetical protein